MIEITVGWGCQFQCAETDIVESFVVNTEGFIGIFDQLVNGQGCIVGFNDGV